MDNDRRREMERFLMGERGSEDHRDQLPAKRNLFWLDVFAWSFVVFVSILVLVAIRLLRNGT